MSNDAIVNAHIEEIKKSIEPLRRQVVSHKVYQSISSLDDLRIFMKYHIYAVWDFMSLLKSLQNSLTCTTVPWVPKGEGKTRYLINEIVAGEESDVDMDGNHTSHFELYLSAMEQCGAETDSIETFLAGLNRTHDLEAAFQAANTPEKAREFVRYTFETIGQKQEHVLAAVFTFGREDLIPDMFHQMVSDLYINSPESISIFKYYLERHIEVDGGHHGQLALEMTSALCGENESHWKQTQEHIATALQMRIALWDGAYEEILAHAATLPESQKLCLDN
ncbi:Protein of unknown function [Dyadobacter soli]|uniref:DUF3050 domain-containing protein n=2 Tax=Dyadobacter soli TaxID=659014 RepID=A0A1G8BS41_9BACT|nr:Protein of unknown function [Dyadobacter soli]